MSNNDIDFDKSEIDQHIESMQKRLEQLQALSPRLSGFDQSAEIESLMREISKLKAQKAEQNPQ